MTLYPGSEHDRCVSPTVLRDVVGAVFALRHVIRGCRACWPTRSCRPTSWRAFAWGVAGSRIRREATSRRGRSAWSPGHRQRRRGGASHRRTEQHGPDRCRLRDASRRRTGTDDRPGSSRCSWQQPLWRHGLLRNDGTARQYDRSGDDERPADNATLGRPGQDRRNQSPGRRDPGRCRPPIVFDAAFSGSAHGKIRVTLRRGFPFPPTGRSTLLAARQSTPRRP